ncbi:serine/threonine-protein kinase [Marilutibacter spongiae]|uniref:Serine/threonine protein kinase n=1 Tax=Marilutibacter spongiae TaxID=2025720 RepID=A0A7W3TP08_9GAMM|nr:serine/threonine-protein kinase [Lysobacter spongiae]MBB1061840.1 serine/threonine protein kinase [Lysobacter spongiae]
MSGGAPPDDASVPWLAALALVERVLELPAEQRQAALDHFGGDPETRALARRMLAASESTSVLDAPLPPLAEASEADEAHHALLVGQRLGRWLLTGLLGQGGMSAVYRARSLTPPVGQEAALKLLSLAAATPEGRIRFQREIDILVRLRHPGIAPVHDAGFAADGTPWFAMGLVEGVDIATWQQEQGLDVNDCVELFLQVCDAVAYAHRHLVVHRDIKPSNVLVDSSGRAILLDFGISRLLEGDMQDATSTGLYAFTPRYAAPEQLNGGAISTATDVFGLGSLLHLLLVGRPPLFDASAADAECRAPATLLDRRNDRNRRRLLGGDLGAILQRALARDPARRYPGAAELAMDLRAWREGRPVSAQRDGKAYRFRRFVARHRVSSGLAAGLAISLLAGLAGFAWQAHHARQQASIARDAERVAADAQARAERELQRSEAVRGYIGEIFAVANPGSGREINPTEFVASADALVTDDMEATQPELAADLHIFISGLRRATGDYEGGMASLTEAVSVLDAAGVQAPGLRVRAWSEAGSTSRTLGRQREAFDFFGKALAAADAARLGDDARTMLALDRLAAESAFSGKDQPVDALSTLLGRIESDDALRGTRVHMTALDYLSTAVRLAGGDNFPLQGRRLAIAPAVYADEPGWLAFTYADAVPTYRARRDFETAGRLAAEAIEIADRVYQAPNVVAAIVYCNAAGLALQTGRNAEARSLIERAIAIDAVLQRRYLHAASCLFHQAEAAIATGHPGPALEALDATDAMLDALATAPDASLRGESCGLRALVHLRSGDATAATRALSACEALHGRINRYLPPALAWRAAWMGDPGEASRVLAPWLEAHPLPHDAPDRLMGWQLDWMIASLGNMPDADARRQALRASVAAIPGKWDDRDALLACLDRGDGRAGCLAQAGERRAR